MLSIDTYDRRERLAKTQLPTGEVSAFGTVTSDYLGVRTRVSEEQEIRHYIDGWLDPSIQQYFTEKFFAGPYCFTRFSPHEREILGGLSRRIGQFTREQFGREVRPLPTLLGQTGLFRICLAIRALLGLQRVSVFEAGPGNGYLGALLALAGQQYASIDVTQALYFCQNRVQQMLVPEEFCDWAEDGPPAKRSRIEHVPWWEYVRLRRSCPLYADIVVSNSNLGEMARNAMLYTLRIGREMLAKSKGPGFFLFVSPGWTHVNSAETIAAELVSAGYRRVCEKNFQLYALEGRPIPAEIRKLDEQLFVIRNDGLGTQALGWDNERGLSLVPAIEALEYRREYASDDLELAEYLGMLDTRKYLPA